MCWCLLTVFSVPIVFRRDHHWQCRANSGSSSSIALLMMIIHRSPFLNRRSRARVRSQLDADSSLHIKK